VGRLAAANHVRAVSLMNYLGACSYAGFPSTSHDAKLNPAALERLVAVSGQPLASLQHALPALALVQRSDPTPIPTITWLATIRVPGPFAACARCVAGRGLDARPIVYLPGHWHLDEPGHQRRPLGRLASPQLSHHSVG